MEKFKLDIFKEENEKPFPHFEKVSNKDCDLFKKTISIKSGLEDNETDSIKILNSIREKSKLLRGVNADTENFDFKLLINQFQIPEPEFININWYRFDEIDKFKLVDFSNNLQYIWYPGPDDIEIFPDDVSWIISIDESGDIYLLS